MFSIKIARFFFIWTECLYDSHSTAVFIIMLGDALERLALCFQFEQVEGNHRIIES